MCVYESGVGLCMFFKSYVGMCVFVGHVCRLIFSRKSYGLDVYSYII